MRRIGTVLLLVIMFATMGLGAAQAQSVGKKQRAEVHRFAANNSLFVLYHEVAHLLVDQLDLPVLGREEDAADNMATWTLLNTNTTEADQALIDAAYGWILSGIAYGSELDDTDYYAAHSLDRQRAFQIVCLMVGSNADEFGAIATEYAIDAERQESCDGDYATVDRSLKGLLDNRQSKKSTEVTVTYHDVSGRLKPAADAFKESGVFDQVANELRSNYNIDKAVQFNARRCGEANAFYDPDTVEIIFCYELMQDYIDLYSENMNREKAMRLPPRSTGLGRAVHAEL